MSKPYSDRYRTLTEMMGQLRKAGEGDSCAALDVCGDMDGAWHGMSEEERVRATVHELRVYRETSR